MDIQPEPSILKVGACDGKLATPDAITDKNSHE